MNSLRKNKIIILLFVAFTLPCGFSSRLSAVVPWENKIKIYTHKKNLKTAEIRRFFIELHNAASYLTRNKTTYKDSHCSVIFLDKKIKNNLEILSVDNNLKIYLPEDPSLWEKNLKTHSSIISALLLQKYGIKPDNLYMKVPDWITSALLRRVRRQMDKSKIPGIPAYPGIHAMMTENFELNPWIFIKHPLKYEDNHAYELYSEGCELLLESILRISGGKNAVQTIVKLAVDGISPEAAFKTSIKKLLEKHDADSFLSVPSDISEKADSSDLKIELWFKSSAQNLSVNLFNPAPGKFTEKMLIRMQKISYREKAEGDKHNRQEYCCDIEDFPEKSDKIEDPILIVSRHQKCLTELLYQSSMILHPSMGNICGALSYLKTGEKRKFRSKYTKAKSEFHDAFGRLTEIESFLAAQEQAFIPPSYRYSEQLKILEESRKPSEALWPDLHKYLDGEEKLYLEK